jgi:hypothetical protein
MMHGGVGVNGRTGSEHAAACRHEAAVRIRAAVQCLGPPEDWIDLELERVAAASEHLARAEFWTREALRA